LSTSLFIKPHDKKITRRTRNRLAAEIKERTQFDWFSVARIHETRGNDKEALKAYEESIKLDPKYAKAWFYKAKLHYKLGQKRQAQECVKRVLELEPDWKRYIEKYLPNL
jgi:tetratricopeptide (TPR) repeat protein